MMLHLFITDVSLTILIVSTRGDGRILFIISTGLIITNIECLLLLIGFDYFFIPAVITSRSPSFGNNGNTSRIFGCITTL